MTNKKASETREEALQRFWNDAHPRYTFDASHLGTDVHSLQELGKLTPEFRGDRKWAAYADNQGQLYVVHHLGGVPMAAEVSRPMKHWDTGYRLPRESSVNLKDQLIRLGYEKPELREHLTPVLDKISASSRNKKASVKSELHDIYSKLGQYSKKILQFRNHTDVAGTREQMSLFKLAPRQIIQAQNSLAKIIGTLD